MLELDGAGMGLGETESNLGVLALLKEAFAIWNHASGSTKHRAHIVALCGDYRKLFASLPKTDTQRFAVRITAIHRNSQSIPNERLHELDDAFAALNVDLRIEDAEYGEKILNAQRHDRFITSHL